MKVKGELGFLVGVGEVGRCSSTQHWHWPPIVKSVRHGAGTGAGQKKWGKDSMSDTIRQDDRRGPCGKGSGKCKDNRRPSANNPCNFRCETIATNSRVNGRWLTLRFSKQRAGRNEVVHGYDSGGRVCSARRVACQHGGGGPEGVTGKSQAKQSP